MADTHKSGGKSRGRKKEKKNVAVGVAHVAVARAEPALVRVLPEVALPRLPVWLTAPEVLRTSPRIRFVFDRLATALEAIAAP